MKIKIGDITRIRTGKLDANAASQNEKYPFFTCSRETLKISSYSYDCEAVLVAGNGDLNVKYYKGKFDAYQRTYIIEDSSNGKLFMPYLYSFMEEYVEQLRRESIGGVIKYIKLGNLTNAIIDLPDIEQQKAIVFLLNKVKDILSFRRHQLQQLDTLIKARFVEMFGDVLTKAKMKDVCSIITDGTHQPPKFAEEGIPFIFVSNITNNEIDYNAEKHISQDTYDDLIKRTPIEMGDIVLSTVGSYGHPAVVKSHQKFLFQRHIAYLKPRQDIVNSEFLHSAILSNDVQNRINENVKGIAQKTLNLSAIKNLEIPLPNLRQQEKFVEFKNCVTQTKATIQQSLDTTQLLLDSLMQRYF